MPPTGSRLNRSRVADQLAAHLRRQILDGELPNGARLPSERELAARYCVSVPTIRESIRVLTAMGLLNTRNGSRTTVTANSDTLLRMAIASVAQFEKMRAGELLALLGVLNTYAAQLAVEQATDAEIDQLRAATEQTADLTRIGAGPAALLRFFAIFSTISHNPLLSALCKALTEIQIGMAVELSDRDPNSWARVATAMYPERAAITAAIARRDPAAADLVRDYHRNIITRTRELLPRNTQLPHAESILTDFLATWLTDGVHPRSSTDQPR